MVFCRGPCLCGSAVCGPKCDCDCHKYDAYDCSSIINAIKYFNPRISVAELAGKSRNELFRWIQKNAKALHECMPAYLAEMGLADDEIDEEEYLTVPFDISQRMGELEPDGCNVPNAKRKSQPPILKRKASNTPQFWEPACRDGLCDLFGLKPSTVIRRAKKPSTVTRGAKKQKSDRRS